MSHPLPGYDYSACSFTCLICLTCSTNFTGNKRIVGSSPVCLNCVTNRIVPLFENAMESEQNYPPKWFGQELAFDEFEYLLWKGARQDWFEKVLEYETPASERVYCRRKACPGIFHSPNSSSDVCDTFVVPAMPGRLAACPFPHTYDGAAYTCLQCRAPAMMGWHKCKHDTTNVYSNAGDSSFEHRPTPGGLQRSPEACSVSAMVDSLQVENLGPCLHNNHGKRESLKQRPLDD